MVKLHERADAYMRDMKKRAAKEFADGTMSKAEFDDIMQTCTSLADKCKKASKSGGEKK